MPWAQAREGSSPSLGTMVRTVNNDKNLHAYIVGLALGDGNLSNSNGRAVKLRITCDTKYKKLNNHIHNSLQRFLPDNKVGYVKRGTSLDIYCYSNKLENLLGWKAKLGSKYKQKVKIPEWILQSVELTKECLRGLVQTDGSIYNDRGYLMVNIVSNIPSLAESIIFAISSIGYKSNVQLHDDLRTKKYTIRISKNTQKFVSDLKVWKK